MPIYRQVPSRPRRRTRQVADAEIGAEWDAFISSLQRPATQARNDKLLELGFHKPGDVETRLGHFVGQLGN
jgi:hypothetical protein